MKKIDVEITGIAPLLHNRYQTEDNGVNKSKKKTKVYFPEEEAKKSLYLLPDGRYYSPSEHILQAIIKASVNFKYEGKKTYKDLMSSSILIEPDAIPLITSGYEIDARPVVIQRARVMCWRPKFNNWKLQFILTVLDDDNISVSTMKEILDNAGLTKAIGTYRPRFGRFMVTKFQEIGA